MVWFYGWKPLIGSCHFGTFNGRRPCVSSRDITYLIWHVTSWPSFYAWKPLIAIHWICHVNLQDEVIKGPVTSWKKASMVHPRRAKFGSHRHFGSGYMVILICYMISQDHVIILSCENMGRSRHPVKFFGHRHCVSVDMFLVSHVILQDHVII